MLLASGDHILQRLKAECPSVGGNVFSTADLADVAEQAQTAPALHLVLLDYRPKQSVGPSVLWDETWCVVAVVRHAARRDRAWSFAEAAAPLLREAVLALSGWCYEIVPGDAARLEAVAGPRPAFSAGFAYFPLAFRAVVSTPRSPGYPGVTR